MWLTVLLGGFQRLLCGKNFMKNVLVIFHSVLANRWLLLGVYMGAFMSPLTIEFAIGFKKYQPDLRGIIFFGMLGIFEYFRWKARTVSSIERYEEVDKKLSLIRILLRLIIKKDTTFFVIIFVVLTFVILLVLYPLIYVVSSSFSDKIAVMSGRVLLWPVEPSVEGYGVVFGYREIWEGYLNTVIYTVFGTALNVVMTMILAYPLSRKDFIGRNIIMFTFTFTMFFNGGLIPTFLLIRDLGLIDTRLVMILPWAIGVWNVIITRTYLQSSIPGELYEAARVDGASNMRMFTMIVIPLSGPIIAVIALFYAVGHWNQFFNALIYLRSKELRPLQIILREILVLNSPQALNDMMASATQEELDALQDRAFLSAQIQFALIIISTAPILAVYPFVQKYFVKGVMIGAIKG